MEVFVLLSVWMPGVVNKSFLFRENFYMWTKIVESSDDALRRNAPNAGAAAPRNTDIFEHRRSTVGSQRQRGMVDNSSRRSCHAVEWHRANDDASRNETIALYRTRTDTRRCAADDDDDWTCLAVQQRCWSSRLPVRDILKDFLGLQNMLPFLRRRALVAKTRAAANAKSVL